MAQFNLVKFISILISLIQIFSVQLKSVALIFVQFSSSLFSSIYLHLHVYPQFTSKVILFLCFTIHHESFQTGHFPNKLNTVRPGFKV